MDAVNADAAGSIKRASRLAPHFCLPFQAPRAVSKAYINSAADSVHWRALLRSEGLGTVQDLTGM
jgi:hypothetical protein